MHAKFKFTFSRTRTMHEIAINCVDASLLLRLHNALRILRYFLLFVIQICS